MNEDQYSTKWVCCELGISDTGLRKKAASAGVEPIVINRKLFYTMEQINKIKNHKVIKLPAIRHEKYDEIILYWKFSKENSSPQIAEKFNIKKSQVNSILDSYLNDLKTKTIETKTDMRKQKRLPPELRKPIHDEPNDSRNKALQLASEHVDTKPIIYDLKR